MGNITAMIEMVLKNFKLLIRSKTSALIILVGPLFIIFLIGTAFNTTGLHNVRIGVFANTYTDLSEDLIEDLRDNEFIVEKTASEDDCIEMVKNGGTQLCIVLPDDLEDTESTREMFFHVDYSRINLVFTILNVINKEVEDISSDLSIEYTTLLLEKINETSYEIKSKGVMLGDLTDNAHEMKNKVTEIQTDMDSIVIDSSEFGLDSMEDYIAESQAQLEEFSSMGTDAIDEGLSMLSTVETYIDDFENMLSEQLTSLEGYKDEVDTYAGVVCLLDFSGYEEYLDDLDPCTEITSIQTALDSAVTDAASVGDSFDDIKTEIDSVRDTLESTQTDQESMTSNASSGLDSMTTQLETTNAKIDELKSTKEGISTEIQEIYTTLDDNIGTLEEIQASINDLGTSLEEVEVNQAEKIVNPILTRIKPIIEEKSYLDYTLPALLVLVIMSMSILLSSTIVLTEKHSRAYFRNYITPIKDYIFLLSIYITNLIVVLIQSMILIVIAQFVFGVDIFSNLPSILLAITIISSVFIIIGMIIGYIFVSEETSTLAAISMISVFLLFSSFLIPIESLSETVGMIAAYNPFVLAETVLRYLIIFQRDITSGGISLLILCVYVVIGGILLYLSEKLDKKRLKG